MAAPAGRDRYVKEARFRHRRVRVPGQALRDLDTCRFQVIRYPGGAEGVAAHRGCNSPDSEESVRPLRAAARPILWRSAGGTFATNHTYTPANRLTGVSMTRGNVT